MIDIDVILSLIGLAILGAGMHLIAVQQKRLLSGESVRLKHLSRASTLFLYSAYFDVFLIFLAIFIKVLMPFEKSFTVMNGLQDSFDFMFLLLSIIVMLWGFSELIWGMGLKGEFRKHMEELQKAAVLKLIEKMDSEGIKREDLTARVEKMINTQKKPQVTEVLSALSALGGETREIFNLWITWLGVDDLFEVLPIVMPTFERINEIIDALIQQKKVIQTKNGHLISQQHLKQLVEKNCVKMTRQRLWRDKTYEWVR